MPRDIIPADTGIDPAIIAYQTLSAAISADLAAGKAASKFHSSHRSNIKAPHVAARYAKLEEAVDATYEARSAATEALIASEPTTLEGVAAKLSGLAGMDGGCHSYVAEDLFADLAENIKAILRKRS